MQHAPVTVNVPILLCASQPLVVTLRVGRVYPAPGVPSIRLKAHPASPHLLWAPHYDSDNLSAPLCLFPARAEDLSLISAAAAAPASPPEPNSNRSDTHGRTRTGSLKRRLSRLSVSSEGSKRDSDVGDNGGFVAGGGSGGANGNSAELRGRFGGDVGRLWMSEDGGYLCVDLLLERTIEELAEGLAFAAR